MVLSDFIELDSSKRFGKPIIIGTRITVFDILNMLANGMDSNEIRQDFPELTENHIKATLLYAAERENHLGIAS